MSRTATSIASFGVLSALTVGGAAPSQKSIAPMPTHAIRGVVKSVSTFYVVVVAGSGKKSREMTFLLGPSTEKDGELDNRRHGIGSVPAGRPALVSTAVSAQPEKHPVVAVPRR